MSDRIIVIRHPAERVIVQKEGVRVIVRAPGPQGPQGLPGADGLSGAVFEFTQASPATPWVVNHNLNLYPSVTVIVGGEETDADITYGSLNQVTISFASPQAGIARLRP